MLEYNPFFNNLLKLLSDQEFAVIALEKYDCTYGREREVGTERIRFDECELHTAYFYINLVGTLLPPAPLAAPFCGVGCTFRRLIGGEMLFHVPYAWPSGSRLG